MFYQFISLGIMLAFRYCSAFPTSQDNRIKRQGGTLQEALEQLQTVQRQHSLAQRDLEKSQLRGSRPNQESYIEPGSSFGPGFSSSDHDSDYSFLPTGPGSNRPESGNRNPQGHQRRPIIINGAGGQGFSTFGDEEYDSGNSNSGAWSTGNGNQVFDIFREPGSPSTNQVNSGGFNDQQGSGDSANQESSNLGGSSSASRNQQQGGQSWTTVQAPMNRIYLDNTVQETPCIERCPSVNHYDPICGTDNITYRNRGKFQCAQGCGRVVNEAHPGACVISTST